MFCFKNFFFSLSHHWACEHAYVNFCNPENIYCWCIERDSLFNFMLIYFNSGRITKCIFLIQPKLCFPRLLCKSIEYHWASLVAQAVKNLPAMWKTQIWSLGQEDLLEKKMATHSSILAWKIPWREKPSRLQSTGCQELDKTEWLTLSLSFIGYH